MLFPELLRLVCCPYLWSNCCLYAKI